MTGLDGRAGTFALDRGEPVHRWYPYVEGYSSGLVQALLREHPGARRILDPFAGSGTTPLVATLAGLDAGYAEVNPLMRLLVRAKVDSSRELASRGVEGVRRAFARLRSLREAPPASVNDLRLAFEKRAFFPEGSLRALRSSVAWIDENVRDDPALHDLARAAVACVTVACSNMKRASDLRYRRERELDQVQRDPAGAIEAKLAEMEHDLVALAERGVAFGRATLLGEDARALPRDGEPFDLAITSPPDLRGTNAFRNAKLELLVLGLIADERELAEMHGRALTAGIDGVSKRLEPPRPFDAVEPIARELERCAHDERIPTLVRAYASDMARVLEGVRALLVPGGVLLLDIGESRFCGVHVPTDRILVSLAEELGLVHLETRLLRRRSAKDGSALAQVLLRFERPRAPVTTDPLAREARAFVGDLPHARPPFAARNWGHPLHSLCSYQGKLKPALAHHLVARFTRPGDLVLDPLGGVGTVAFEAALQGRRALSNDVNPVAVACARAKLGVPTRAGVERVMDGLARALEEGVPRPARLPAFNGPLEDYYHPDVLEQILRARAFFSGREPSGADEALVLASLLHVLHGNRPYALSRRSHPLTPFKPTGPSVAKSLVGKVGEKLARSLVDRGSSFVEGRALAGDFRTLGERLGAETVDAVICSPPFVGSTRFYLANWIRLWFCGWEVEDFDERGRPADFLEVRQRADRGVYREFFSVVRGLLRPRGVVILHLGATRRVDMGEELAELARQGEFSVVGLFREDVTHVEKHGVADQGATVAHELLFLRAR